jgi:hypothetical protein
MRGQRFSFQWGGILFLLLIGAVAAGLAGQGTARGSEGISKVRSDIVTIDAMAEHGELELPPVTFLHDKHTEAVKKKEERPCLSCHVENEKEKRLEFTFKKVAEAKPSAMKDAFHEACISCHDEYLAEGKDSGPTESECRSCHTEDPGPSNRLAMGLNKVLHYRHIDAEEIPDLELSGQEDENCGRCHHEYDVEAGELVPETEEEGSCRYCHETEPYKLEGADVTVKPLPEASHLQCVNCHRDLRLSKAENKGPEECASCHGIVARKQVEANNEKVVAKLDGELPRLERGQPDAALITAVQPEDYLALREEDRPRTIAPAPFDHVAHERGVENCRTCHHEAIKSCNSCHDIAGKEEGEFVQLADAMHMPDSERSCAGCHNLEKQRPVCAGCHSQMEEPARVENDTCAGCHQEEPAGEAFLAAADSDVLTLSVEKQNEKAEALIESRADEPGLYDEEDIPEKVTVDAMADEYEPAEFPHRRIVLYLADEVGKSGMGAYFHSEEGLLCRGCHHNSPAAAEPPSCVSCHGKPFDEKNMGRPGLKAAYHGQCMGCHSAMGIEGKEIVKDKPVPANTDCKGCHAEKK